MTMVWWDKMMAPMRKVLTKVSKWIAFRKNGLGKLHHDVRRCEYEDVHILWDMLKKKQPDLIREPKRPFWKRVDWTKCAPLLCRGV